MNNLTFPPSFQRKDNGERIIYWETGNPKWGGYFLITEDDDENTGNVIQAMYNIHKDKWYYADLELSRPLAFAKLPIGYNQLKG